jgi:hypothetical protein
LAACLALRKDDHFKKTGTFGCGMRDKPVMFFTFDGKVGRLGLPRKGKCQDPERFRVRRQA